MAERFIELAGKRKIWYNTENEMKERVTGMTIVELFDKSAVENIVSCLTFQPEKLIYVGDHKFMEQNSQGLCRFLESRFPKTEVVFRGVRRNDLEDILSVLTEIIEENPGCAFDLTGGEDLLLFAVGMLAERFHTKGVQLHRFNVRTGRVTDFDGDGQPVPLAVPALTVEDTITLHGGLIVKGKTDAPWLFEESIRQDVEAMWEISRADCARWNTQSVVLNGLYSHRQPEEDPLKVQVDLSTLSNAWQRSCADKDFDTFMAGLCQAGMLLDCDYTAPMLSYRYKSPQVRRCLEKAGNLLELMTCLVAKDLKTAKGQPRFSDAMTGVTIDWDGEQHRQGSGQVDTANEIDVILMKGLVPIFISCKNGSVGEDELYKLSTVARRFGGKYVKKVLVGTTLGKMPQSSREHFTQRAREMDILLLADLQQLDAKGFAEALSRIDS